MRPRTAKQSRSVLTMMALTKPDLFTFESVGQHKVGAGIDAVAVKRTLLETLTKGLSG